MDLSIITKNHAADPEKGVSHKIDLKAVWPHNGHADSVEINQILQHSKVVFLSLPLWKY